MGTRTGPSNIHNFDGETLLETSAWMTVKESGYKRCEDGWDIVISGVQLPGFATTELIRYILGRYIVRVGNGWNWLRIVSRVDFFGISNVATRLSATALLWR